MTEMTFRRKAAACLVTGVALVWTVAYASSDAQGRSPDAELRAVLEQGPSGANVISPTRVEWPREGVTILLEQAKADWSGCNGAWVCLYENAHGRGRMIYFAKPGKFRLKAWSMGPDPAHHRGVSSYWKRRSGQAKLWGPNFRHNVTAGKHNLPSSINDRSSYLQLF
jgi:hypothetical protein